MRFLRSRLFLSVIGLGASGTTTLAFNVVLSREFGAVRFGPIAASLAVATALAQIPMSSLIPACGQALARVGGDEQADFVVTGIRWVAAVEGFLAVAFVAVSRMGFFSIERWLLVGVLVFVMLYPLYFFLKVALFARNLIGTYVALEISSDIVFFGLLAFAVHSRRPELGVGSLAAAYVGFIAIAYRCLTRGRPHAHRLRMDRDLLRFSAFSFVGTWTSVGRFPLLLLICGAAAGTAAVGALAPAVALATPLLLVPQAAGMLAFVDGAAGRREKTRHRAASISGLHSVVGWTSAMSAAAVFISAPVVFRHLLGASADPRFILVVAAGIFPLMYGTVYANGLSGRGNVRVVAAVSAASLVVGVPVAYVAAELRGALGAAVAMGLVAAATGIGNLALGSFYLGVPARVPVAVAVASLTSIAAVSFDGAGLVSRVLGASLCFLAVAAATPFAAAKRITRQPAAPPVAEGVELA